MLSPVLTVHLPLPQRSLRPNVMRRCHWAPVATARAKARTDALIATKAALSSLPLSCSPKTYGITWIYKGRRPDADNCLASCKSYLDGCCDAIGINDVDLDVLFVHRKHDCPNAGQLVISFFAEPLDVFFPL